MKKFDEWPEMMMASGQQFFQTVVHALPNIIGAILLLLMGWIAARLLMYATRRLLRARAFRGLTEKLNQVLHSPDISLDAADIISRFVYWVVLLLSFIAASETLGWAAVSQAIGSLIGYLPALLSAVVILVIGLYIARMVRGFIRTALQSLEIGSARIISSFAFYVLALMAVLTALNQAGIDTSVITSNLMLIIGSVMVAFAIAFALASREILQNILSAFYSRRNFRAGDVIKIGTLQGQIIRIDSVSVVLKTDSSEVVLPAQTLISVQVEKISKQGFQP